MICRPSAEFIENGGVRRLVFRGFHNAHLIPDLVTIRPIKKGKRVLYSVSVLDSAETEVVNSLAQAEHRGLRSLLSLISFLAESIKDSFEDLLEDTDDSE